jgi:hypothetical protein
MHSDPRAVARMARWVVIVVAALSIPLLFFLLVKEQWTAAIALTAGMILVAAALGGRMLRWIGFRAIVLDRSAPADANTRRGFDGGFVDDPELVRRSAAVLEAYLRHTSGPARDSGAGLSAIEGRTNGSGRAKANGHAESPDPEIMPQEEALAILGLEPGATEREISQAQPDCASHPPGWRRFALSCDQGGSGEGEFAPHRRRTIGACRLQGTAQA